MVGIRGKLLDSQYKIEIQLIVYMTVYILDSQLTAETVAQAQRRIMRRDLVNTNARS